MAGGPAKVLIVGALALTGCHHRQEKEADPLKPLLLAADHAWDARADNGMDAAESALLEAWPTAPKDPRVLWRLARLNVEKGLAEEATVDRIYDFAAARALAVGCLEDDEVFVQTRQSEGWPAAAAEVLPDRSQCAGWAALAWVRWLAEVGPEAAALDLPAIDALITAGRTGADPSAADWAGGLLAAIRPAWSGRDPATARAALSVEGRGPGTQVREADLLERVAIPEGDAALQASLCAALTPEPTGKLAPADQVARKRSLPMCSAPTE
jgi:hypothetical protein